MTPSALTSLGRRGDTASFGTGFSTVADDIVPIAQAGVAAGTSTYNGQTVVRGAVMRVTRSLAALVAVKGTVATVLPYYGTRAVSYWDLGQVLDGNGVPTGTYVSWRSPGQVWSRGTGFNDAAIANGPTTSFGTRLTAVALLNVADLDYAVGVSTTGVLAGAVDLAATQANPGAAGNVKAVAPPSGWSGNVTYLPHRGAILLVPDSNSKVTSPQISLDLGATWTAVAVSGTPIYGVPGSPLFDF